MGINFGGFVGLSTVDWIGRAACVVFFRGCPAKCWYCHNPQLRKGDYDIKSDEEILELINRSKPLVSAVVFSGGEPTMQSSIVELARKVKRSDFDLAIHTSGLAPDTLENLIISRNVDKIQMDIKTVWGRNFDTYDRLMNGCFGYHVRKSLNICDHWYNVGILPEFEVVTTLFNGINTDDVFKIQKYFSNDIKWILNQGIAKGHYVMTKEDLMELADKLKRNVYIRTKEDGEFKYEKRV